LDRTVFWCTRGVAARLASSVPHPAKIVRNPTAEAGGLK
jgi:hypothetical protein